jgi:hypothetical protein
MVGSECAAAGHPGGVIGIRRQQGQHLHEGVAAFQAQCLDRGRQARDLLPQGRPAIKGTARRQPGELAGLIGEQRRAEAAQAGGDHARQQFLDQGERSRHAAAIGGARELARQLVQGQTVDRLGCQRRGEPLV